MYLLHDIAESCQALTLRQMTRTRGSCYEQTWILPLRVQWIRCRLSNPMYSLWQMAESRLRSAHCYKKRLTVMIQS